MKIFSLFRSLPWTSEGAFRDGLGDRAAWLRDPLSHPMIETMSQRELADLPFRTTARPTPMENCPQL